MADAYNAVMKGDMSVTRASKHFGVNKKSLLRRTRGDIPVNACVGKATALSSHHEQELAECIKLLAGWGWGFTSEEVKNIVRDFTKEMQIDTPFTEGRPGDDWFRGFLMRHPDIVPRKTEHLSNARARAEDPEVIKHFFQLFHKVLMDTQVKDMSAQIFNVDESGFVTDPKSQIVLAEKGSKRVTQNIGGSGREQITVNCAASASGKVLPPYVVYQGKNLYLAWTQGGPDGACYTTSAKGWMEAPQFLDWFVTIFLPHTADVSNKPRILVFDGHASHLSLDLMEKAKENNVVMMRLPAHLTHLLQPLDRAVFRPVKAKWQSLLVKHARTHTGPVGKKDFPAMLKALFNESFTIDTIKAGFRSTGLCPFNAAAVVVPERPQVGAIADTAPSATIASTASTSDPQPSTSDPQPQASTSDPQPSTSDPQPSTSQPLQQPSRLLPPPQTPSPPPQILSPRPPPQIPSPPPQIPSPPPQNPSPRPPPLGLLSLV